MFLFSPARPSALPPCLQETESPTSRTHPSPPPSSPAPRPPSSSRFSAKMYNGEPPEGWSGWLLGFLERHFVRAKGTETKNRGGSNSKKGNFREDGEGVPAMSIVIPRDRTLDSSSPPLIPAHISPPEFVIAASKTKDGARKRHRRRRPRTRRLVDHSSGLQPDGLIESATVVVAAHESTLDAPAPVVLADTDTEGWQDARKKRHGGRTGRAAQGLNLEPTIIENDALKPTIAENEQAPKAIVDEPRPVRAFDIVPTPKDESRVEAIPSDGWQISKKPRARWVPIPLPARLAPPTPPRRASSPARSTRQRAHQGDESEEENDDFGIKRMFELERREADEEDNEREEKEMHLNFWIRNKKLKGKTLCLVCYLEQKTKVPEIENEEKQANRHLKVAHNMKRREYLCQIKGCWVTGRNKREIGIHQLVCHNR